MKQSEFEALIKDSSKIIDGDITWNEDEDHSPTVEFRADLSSETGYPLFVRGSYNKEAKALTYAIIHKSYGRIYGLDLGKDHHNPSCEYVGEKHKHRWDEKLRDKQAYVPDDITASTDDPITVWRQFCLEAKINHNGLMHHPPPIQMDMF